MAIELDFMESYDQKSIVRELRRISEKLGKKTLTWSDINKHGLISAHTVYEKFGTMGHAHKAAGLVPSTRLKYASDEVLLKLLVDLWKTTSRELGRSPGVADVSKYNVSVSATTFIVRFGSWKKALVAAASLAPSSTLHTRQKPRRDAPKERGYISIRKRFLIFKRDRYTCRICHYAGGELEVDHIVPISKGGVETLDNLQTLCRKCNRGKGGSRQ